MGGFIRKVSTVPHDTAIQQQKTGAAFAARKKEQALRAGVEIVCAEVTQVALTGEVNSITADQASTKLRGLSGQRRYAPET